MKNKKMIVAGLFLLNLFLYNSVEAQIFDMYPLPGERFEYEDINLTPQDTGSIGTGQAWDFSNATVGGNHIIYTYSELTASEQSNFPFANMKYTSNYDNEKHLLNHSADSLTLCGIAIDTIITANYTNPDIHYIFPITDTTYSFIDTLRFEYDSFGTPVVVTGISKITVQGTGTLTTFWDSYSDVYKIKKETVLNYYVFGNLYDQVYYNLYSWITEEINDELLNINSIHFVNHTNPDGFYSSYLYEVTETAGISEEVNDKSIIYPNPAADQMNIQTDAEKAGYFEVVDLLGQLVLKENISANDQAVHISSLSPGQYIVRIFYKNGGITNHRLLKL